jgi:SAM-dependent methyltransferase
MNTSTALRRRIRRNYDDQPYPGRGRNPSYPVPVEWIDALLRPGQRAAPPGRILVAGCGTGAEAFALRRRFPEADIVGIDFSPASIAIAIDLQRRRSGRRVRFVVADLGSRALHRRVGSGYDLISCHGVMTYVPSPGRALSGLAHCLAEGGALYLGVNGSGHVSVQLRKVIRALGIDTTRFVHHQRVRDALAICDAVLPPAARVSRSSAPYLASDVFGALFQNLPLSAWMRLARRAGLYLHGSSSSYRCIRTLAHQGHLSLLVPRSRAKVCELLDLLEPIGFHRLALSKRAPENPPWARPGRLMAWRPVLTGLFRCRWPDGQALRSSARSRDIVFTSPAMNTHLTVNMPAWQIDLLRRADGTASIAEILTAVGARLQPDDVVRPLYELDQLVVLGLLPPGPPGQAIS